MLDPNPAQVAKELHAHVGKLRAAKAHTFCRGENQNTYTTDLSLEKFSHLQSLVAK